MPGLTAAFLPSDRERPTPPCRPLHESETALPRAETCTPPAAPSSKHRVLCFAASPLFCGLLRLVLECMALVRRSWTRHQNTQPRLRSASSLCCRRKFQGVLSENISLLPVRLCIIRLSSLPPLQVESARRADPALKPPTTRPDHGKEHAGIKETFKRRGSWPGPLSEGPSFRRYFARRTYTIAAADRFPIKRAGTLESAPVLLRGRTTTVGA